MQCHSVRLLSGCLLVRLPDLATHVLNPRSASGFVSLGYRADKWKSVKKEMCIPGCCRRQGRRRACTLKQSFLKYERSLEARIAHNAVWTRVMEGEGCRSRMNAYERSTSPRSWGRSQRTGLMTIKKEISASACRSRPFPELYFIMGIGSR